VSPVDDIPRDWPHNHGATRTWIKDGETKYVIICSFCRIPIGQWNYTKISEKKNYPENTNAKFSLKQRKLMI
jgi:hypothetical protein